MLLVFSAAVSLIMTLAIIPIILYVARRKEWYDSNNHRKIHNGNIPRLGGIGIFFSFMFTLLLMSFIVERSSSAIMWSSRYIPILVAGVLIHFLGIVDDFRNLRARLKLLVQVCASVLVILAGFHFLTVLAPVAPFHFAMDWMAYPITFIWLIGMTNAINLIDGMDGFAGGVSAIIAATFSLFFILRGNAMAAIISLALLGGLIGFLIFNFPPAKIFMGDSGSLFLGFMLGILPILDMSNSRSSMNVVSSISLMAIPILDVLSAVWRRIRRGVSCLIADREHIHHKLLDMGFSTRQALALLCGLQLVLSAAGLSTLYFMQGAFFINVAAWLIAICFFSVSHYLARRVEKHPAIILQGFPLLASFDRRVEVEFNQRHIENDKVDRALNG
jgi:UDP-GlcNAc:undecaprenyl-phosphate GlcNAc-1-phosphate transferase